MTKNMLDIYKEKFYVTQKEVDRLHDEGHSFEGMLLVGHLANIMFDNAKIDLSDEDYKKLHEMISEYQKNEIVKANKEREDLSKA